MHAHIKKTRETDGVALIVTLAIMAMILMLLLAFSSTVRLQRQIARSSSDELRSRLIAQAGIDQAINILTGTTSNLAYITAYSNANWATPSLQIPILQVWYTNGATITNLASASVANLASSMTNTANTVDMNFREPIVTNSMVANPFVFNWTYVTNTLTTNNSTYIGRYVFWCDDESMKMNVNVSGTNTAMFGGNLSEMNLENIPGMTVNIASNSIIQRPFETLQTFQELNNPSPGMLESQYNLIKYFTTIYSANTNSWKININNLTNANQIATTLASYCPAVSNKYTGGQWMQFSANLLEYISTNIQPHSPTNYNGFPLIGRNSNPLIDEITLNSSIYGTTNGANNSFTVTNTFSVKLFNLYSKSWNSTSWISAASLPSIVISNLSVVSPGSQTIPFTNIISGPATFANYANITFSTNLIQTVNFSTNGYSGVQISLQNPPPFLAVTLTNTLGMVDYGNIIISNQTTGTVLAALPASSNMFFVDMIVANPGDPRVMKTTNLWISAAAQALNTTNANFHPDLGPDQDASSRLSTDGGYFFRNGPMKSIGELGLISLAFNTTNDMWRSFRLYGDGNASVSNLSYSEDYRLLDFVTVTNAASLPMINLNGNKEDMSSAGVLCSLLAGASIPANSYGTNAGCFTIIGQSNAYILATNIVATGQSSPASQFLTIGDWIARSSNSLSSVNPVLQNTKWRREGPLRSIANFLTTHGEQFTIYSYGQSLRITQGRTNVTGSAYMQSVVERIPVASPTNVIYKTIYHRVLTE